MKISYGITVKDELIEIQKLLNQISLLKNKDDEVVVIYDEKNGSKEVKEYLKTVEISNFKLDGFKFNDDFSELKNFLISRCSGDYIFNLDADEYLTEQQHSNIISILEKNQHLEAFKIPRINILVGLTEEYVKENKMIINEKGWWSYPDYQTRIFKNKSSIRWVNRVHEALVGAAAVAALEAKEEYSILHIKTLQRQKKQHEYYTEKFYKEGNT